MTKEEVLKLDYTIAGTEPDPDFIISLVSGREAKNNMFLTIDLENLLNNNLTLSKYANDSIQTITITALSPYDGTGVNWLERKLFKRKTKNLFIDIIFEKYNEFCKADKQEALKLLAEQTVKATEKYLPKIKEIDYKRFHTDLIQLFAEHKLV